MSDVQNHDDFVYDLFGKQFFDLEAPVQFRFFDPKICGELQEDWLAYAVKPRGITRPELDSMIAAKLLRRWKDGAGKEVRRRRQNPLGGLQDRRQGHLALVDEASLHPVRARQDRLMVRDAVDPALALRREQKDI